MSHHLLPVGVANIALLDHFPLYVRIDKVVKRPEDSFPREGLFPWQKEERNKCHPHDSSFTACGGCKYCLIGPFSTIQSPVEKHF